MLNNLSEQIRECLRHPEDCAGSASAQTDPQLKQDFLGMGRRWLFLPRSYELTGRVTDFTANNKPEQSVIVRSSQSVRGAACRSHPF